MYEFGCYICPDGKGRWKLEDMGNVRSFGPYTLRRAVAEDFFERGPGWMAEFRQGMKTKRPVRRSTARRRSGGRAGARGR